MNGPDEQPPPVLQHVTAVAGFAYGAVGADVHVFGDGSPLYLLENHRGAAPPDPAWLRQMPSRMLEARYAVVEFTGRERERADLNSWLRDASRFAVRWLHAAGGQGKTRLAAQLAADVAAGGWKVVTASPGTGTVRPSPGSQDLRLGAAPGLLLIVDYADRWPLTQLTWLLRNSLLHQDRPARVLLLARTAYGWPALRAALRDVEAVTSELPLAPLPDDPAVRLRMFTAARDGFAARYGLADPGVISAPGELSRPDLGLTLSIHMAALVAVDAHVHGRRIPADLVGLTGYLLDREREHWTYRYERGAGGGAGSGAAAGTGGAGTGGGGGARLDHATPPGVMSRAVFTAALTGPVAHPTAKAVLTGLDLETHPERVIADHAACYPPVDPDRDTVLEPLYPDRLAEDYLAVTTPGHRVGYPAHAWAAPTVLTLLARNPDDPPPAWTARALTFLTAAAERWPHLAQRCLYPVLRQDPRLAVEAGSPVLVTLAGLPDIDLTLLESIAAFFPPERHVDLDVGIAAVTGRLAEHHLAHTTDPIARVGLVEHLGLRLSHAGHHEQAVARGEEATALCRRLAAADPDTYLPTLAGLLNNLGPRLAAVGRDADALAATEETVGIRRRLAARDPAAYLPNLATSLTNLAAMLSRVGRREEALAPTEEAVALHRRAAATDPAHLPGLALALSNLGATLAEVGRPEEAVPPTEEAVAIRRHLAATNPAAHLPDLASSLANLGVTRSRVGRRAEAVSATEEAVTLHRQLAATNPAAHLPELARALNDLGAQLSHVGRAREALAAIAEAVAIRRQLVATNPAAHLPGLALALANLDQVLARLGQWSEALASAEESVALHRQLAATNAAAHLPGLALALSNLAAGYSHAERRREALAVIGEAVAIRRRLAGAIPAAHRPGLATALTDLGRLLAILNRPREALVPAAEALALRRELTAPHPPAKPTEPVDLAGLAGVVDALDVLGMAYTMLGERDQATTLLGEAVAICRRLAEADPTTYRPVLEETTLHLRTSRSRIRNGLLRRLHALDRWLAPPTTATGGPAAGRPPPKTDPGPGTAGRSD